MPIIYRADLGRNLTPNEVDANFRFLFDLISGSQPLTPRPPTFTNFQDTLAGGTVTIVATDVPMASIVYSLPGSASFRAAPADGVVSVGDVAGGVSVKSLAVGRYIESTVNVSPAFTAAPAPVNFNATPQTYVTTAADYQAKFGQAWVGTYVGISRTSSTGSASTQAAANALALADATTQAKAAMTQQQFQATSQSYTTTAADYQAKFNTAYVGPYVGITRSSTSGTGTTQAQADAQALADATTQAKAAMIAQTAIAFVGSSATAVPTDAEILAAIRQNWDTTPRQLSIPCPLAKPFPFFGVESFQAARTIFDSNNFDATGDFNHTSRTLSVDGTARTLRLSTHQYEQEGTVIFNLSAI